MFTKASVMQKYYIKAIQHQNEFPNEIWHFESQCKARKMKIIQHDKIGLSGAFRKAYCAAKWTIEKKGLMVLLEGL